jgi:hypothetical protein
MRAPGTAFATAIDAYHQRYRFQREEAFFARVRSCPGIPPARRESDYANLAESLSIAWEVANVWSESAEIARQRRESAARQLDAIRLMRKDMVPFDPYGTVKYYLESLEEHYTVQATASEPDEVLPLEYVRRDDLRIADLGREHRKAGIKLFVREVSLAMRKIFGRAHDEVVGRLAGLAFEIKTLSPRTVQSMCKGITLTRQK